MSNSLIAPGLIRGMSNDAYHQASGESKSKLDDIAPECGNSPRHYYKKHVAPDRPPHVRSDEMAKGEAIHSGILEPDSFAADYVVAPKDAPRRPSAKQIGAAKPSADTIRSIAWWEEFDAEAGDRAVFDAPTWAEVIGARDAVLLHPDASGYFQHGCAETSYFAIDPETGELIKCRPDYDRIEYDGMIVDVKSTADASGAGFGRFATRFRYDVADPWYCDTANLALGVKDAAVKFGFVAVQSVPPHAVGVYYVRPDDRLTGRAMGRRDLRCINRCRQSGYWPDFVGMSGAQPLQISPFARRNIAA